PHARDDPAPPELSRRRTRRRFGDGGQRGVARLLRALRTPARVGPASLALARRGRGVRVAARERVVDPDRRRPHQRRNGGKKPMNANAQLETRRDETAIARAPSRSTIFERRESAVRSYSRSFPVLFD